MNSGQSGANSVDWDGWAVQESVSFVSGRVRLLQLNGHLVTEDHLDKRWEAGTGEQVEEIIFLSRHVAASNRPALTLHPIGQSCSQSPTFST